MPRRMPRSQEDRDREDHLRRIQSKAIAHWKASKLAAAYATIAQESASAILEVCHSQDSEQPDLYLSSVIKAYNEAIQAEHAAADALKAAVACTDDILDQINELRAVPYPTKPEKEAS